MGTSMPDIIAPDNDQLHPSTYAAKAWLSTAIYRCNLYPKAIYLVLGIDQSTFSRWLSLEHDQVMPMDHLPAVLALLDRQAVDELVDLITQRRGSADIQKPGANRAS